jgi:hypothetical protein
VVKIEVHGNFARNVVYFSEELSFTMYLPTVSFQSYTSMAFGISLLIFDDYLPVKSLVYLEASAVLIAS